MFINNLAEYVNAALETSALTQLAQPEGLKALNEVNIRPKFEKIVMHGTYCAELKESD